MNRMLQQYQIAITTFMCLYSGSTLNPTTEQYQWFTDQAADMHSTRPTNYLEFLSNTCSFLSCKSQLKYQLF